MTTRRPRNRGRAARHRLGSIVEPAESLTVLADEPDNRIVECALAANAQLIVTGDRAMLALGEYQGIRIISLSACLG